MESAFDIISCSAFCDEELLRDCPAPPARSALVIGFFLILLQAIDGIFTAMGIDRFGLSVEGNPFLREIMAQFGHVPTLAVIKSGAIMLVVLLTFLTNRLPWVKNAMGAVSFIYLLGAVLPWGYLLFL